MSKKYKFPIIPHTHWDREWYFTTSKSIIYSLVDFSEVMEVLEENEHLQIMELKKRF